MTEDWIDAPWKYPWCHFPFDAWNPVQRRCAVHFEEDCNLVLSASTASGKSAVGEAIMGHAIGNGRKAVYVSPLKAIGDEKHAAWSRHETFSRHGIVKLSSDTDVSPGELEEASLVVSTIESLHIRCRARERWLAKAGALVFDEAHLIGDESRGAGSEAMVMELTALNPSCRVVLLSGTMGNALEMAKWLKACNGKPTKYVTSQWRPQRLEKRVVVADTRPRTKDALLKIAADGRDGKTLVFVHSMAAGKEACGWLRDNGFRCAFYSGSLRPEDRDAMLADFRSPVSGLDILVSTSALGAGVTL